jgi:hypothetical protein
MNAMQQRVQKIATCCSSIEPHFEGSDEEKAQYEEFKRKFPGMFRDVTNNENGVVLTVVCSLADKMKTLTDENTHLKSQMHEQESKRARLDGAPTNVTNSRGHYGSGTTAASSATTTQSAVDPFDVLMANAWKQPPSNKQTQATEQKVNMSAASPAPAAIPFPEDVHFSSARAANEVKESWKTVVAENKK